ncbi:MAG: thiamine phosphate synthase [Candidatus Omnitrophota bacterium]
MSEKNKIKDYSLYLVFSQDCALGKSALEITKEAILGGIDILQMREKNKSKDQLLNLGRELRALCKKNNVTFIVNDDPYLVKEIDADGLHLGQEDILKYPLENTRNIIGKNKIIGISTHSIEQFKIANTREDFDYLSYGPIFPTLTKDYFIGTKDIKEVLEITKKPVVFIGGINLSNLDEILDKGAKIVALIRGIMQAKDIVSTTKIFKEKINQKRTPK